MKEIGVGIIGLGIVGSGVYETLMKHSDEIAARTGVKLAIRKAVDLDESRRDQLSIPGEVFSKAAGDVINNGSIDVVVELIGGYSPEQPQTRRYRKQGATCQTGCRTCRTGGEEQSRSLFRGKCSRRDTHPESIEGRARRK
jgi:homoserine dehydrogenase